jgi:hypothetical protein
MTFQTPVPPSPRRKKRVNDAQEFLASVNKVQSDYRHQIVLALTQIAYSLILINEKLPLPPKARGKK